MWQVITYYFNWNTTIADYFFVEPELYIIATLHFNSFTLSTVKEMYLKYFSNAEKEKVLIHKYKVQFTLFYRQKDV